MRSDLTLIPERWLEWEPRGNCHDFGIAEVGALLSAGGTLLGAKSAIDQGAYQKKLGEVQAEELKNKANEDAAAAQRVAITDQRKTDLALSRARAVAAASGTEATSGDILTTEGQIAQQGSYNAASSLYEGQAKARSDTYQADIDLWKGREAANAAPLVAGGTVLSGLSSALTNRAMLRLYTSTGKSPYVTGL